MKRVFVRIFPFLGSIFGMVVASVLHIDGGWEWLFLIAGFGISYYFFDKATTQLSPANSDENYDEILKSEDERVEKEANKIFVMSIIMVFLIGIAIALQTLWPKYKRYNRTCWDVTSIDWNWQNDFKCVNDDGEVKRTDYEGVKNLLGI